MWGNAEKCGEMWGNVEKCGEIKGIKLINVVNLIYFKKGGDKMIIYYYQIINSKL